MKIAIVVPGRFHAFELAKALTARGHEVALLTNYPAWAARRFGISPTMLRTCAWHGALFRLAWAAHQRWGWPFPEALLNRLFGRWAVRTLRRERWDIIHSWSALSQEILEAYRGSGTLIYLMRGSAHIRVQARLLKEEEQRTGAVLDKPSTWVIEREEREYALAEHIVVLSAFAQKSFGDEQVPARKVQRLEIAAPVDRFRPSLDVIEARCERLTSGTPLNVLYVGALSFQKGLFDLGALLDHPSSASYRFTCVGPAYREAKPFLARYANRVKIVGARPEHELPEWYSAADVFIFPTIQDGYALVLAQAAAAILPIIATDHCAAPDLARSMPAIWCVPIRQPDLFAKRLQWCDTNRAEVAQLVRHRFDAGRSRTWEEVAFDFENLVCTPSSNDRRVKTG